MVKRTSQIQAKYDATHCKQYSLKFHIINDEEIIDKLSSVQSIQGYIKQLIRDDIARTNNTSVSKSDTIDI